MLMFSGMTVSYTHLDVYKRQVLRELLSSDSEEFGGSGVHNAPEIRSEDVPFGALPCSARVTLPPLSTVYFTFTNR